jgi:ABC-type molybdenum transport system ATPase subunit/photorepair protein PhrA
MKNLKNLSDAITGVVAERTVLRKRLAELDGKLDGTKIRISQLERAIDITGMVIQGRYSKTIRFLEEVITSGLQVTFDESFKVTLKNDRKANKNNCTFMLSCSEYPGSLPFKMCQGDGAKQVTELILLIVLISVVNGRKILFVDEPLTGIHKGARQEAVAQFLSTICKDLGVQLIMVTHEDSLLSNADNVVVLK